MKLFTLSLTLDALTFISRENGNCFDDDHRETGQRSRCASCNRRVFPSPLCLLTQSMFDNFLAVGMRDPQVDIFQ